MNRLIVLALTGVFFLAGCGPSLTEQRNHALTSLNAGDNEKAQKQFEVITDRYPGDALSFFYLGRAYHAQGKYEMAIFYYQSAISKDPSLTEARIWLNRAVQESGHTGTMLNSPEKEN